jgi:hypothetical protein
MRAIARENAPAQFFSNSVEVPMSPSGASWAARRIGQKTDVEMKRYLAGISALILGTSVMAQEDLGIAELKKAGSHLFTTQKVAPETRVSALAADGTYRCCYKVGAIDPEAQPRMTDEAQSEATVVAYRLTPATRAARTDPLLVGIGFPAGHPIEIAAKSPHATRFTWRGAPYHLSQCTTSEGLRLTLERKGIAVRQYYFTLGHDVEKTCEP